MIQLSLHDFKLSNTALKKTVNYRERNEEKRTEFIETIAIIPKQRITYIDESGLDHNEVKSRSWSPIGKPTLSKQYGYRYKRTSLLAWVRWGVVLAPFRFEWMTDTLMFNEWIEIFLCPELKEWDLVVLDNASFHKSEKTKELIEKTGATLLFLPPYSPDLNPIENYWAILKQFVRKHNTSFETFYEILDGFLSRERWS